MNVVRRLVLVDCSVNELVFLGCGLTVFLCCSCSISSALDVFLNSFLGNEPADVHTSVCKCFLSLMTKVVVMLCVGCEDDGDRGGNICHLLAPISCVFHRDKLQLEADKIPVDPAGLSVDPVALHELLHVQPHHLLLPQQQVSAKYMQLFNTCTHLTLFLIQSVNRSICIVVFPRFTDWAIT